MGVVGKSSETTSPALKLLPTIKLNKIWIVILQHELNLFRTHFVVVSTPK